MTQENNYMHVGVNAVSFYKQLKHALINRVKKDVNQYFGIHVAPVEELPDLNGVARDHPRAQRIVSAKLAKEFSTYSIDDTLGDGAFRASMHILENNVLGYYDAGFIQFFENFNFLDHLDLVENFFLKEPYAHFRQELEGIYKNSEELSSMRSGFREFLAMYEIVAGKKLNKYPFKQSKRIKIYDKAAKFMLPEINGSEVSPETAKAAVYILNATSGDHQGAVEQVSKHMLDKSLSDKSTLPNKSSVLGHTANCTPCRNYVRSIVNPLLGCVDPRDYEAREQNKAMTE